ncbi:MAG: ABC transporter permease subunit, partial [Alphaproteobacteria bacterium]
MSDLSFVRTEMLPPKEPPATEVGVIGWLRENLFSGWKNTVLTILSLLAIYLVLSEILPWIFHSAWNAGSLDECRKLIKSAYGEEASGACWAVIRERWLQLLFGFYPTELYWRPILTFVLLIVAIAPVLFPELPRRLLSFTPIFPFVAVWLLWGGSIWTPIMALLGFVIGYVAFTLVTPRMGAILGVIAAVLVPVIWWLYLAGPVAEAIHGLVPIGLEPVKSRLFGGFMLSITIGVTAIGASLPLGIILALARQSDLFIVKTLSVGFIEFIRGVPLITLLFVASTLLNIFMPPGTNFDIILRVMIMTTIFAAAYMAEVIRGGLAALPKGQYEAAAALGLDYWKSMRLVILPQA